MAAIGNAYAERVTNLPHTGDTNFVDVVTIPAANFVANGVYFIIATGDFSGDNNTFREIRVVHGTTPTVFPGSLSINDSSSSIAGDKSLYGPHVIQFTQPATAEDVKVQMRVQVSTATVNADNVVLWAIRRDVDLVENTDYKYAELDETGAPTQHTTTMKDRASITFTPADNNHDWLVIYSIMVIVDSTTVNWEARIRRDGTEASPAETVAFFAREGENAVEQVLYGSFWPLTLTNASHTLAVQSRDDATGVHDHAFSSILALRLDAFEDHTIFTNTAIIDAFGKDVYGEIGAMDITPQTAGDIILMARATTKEIGSSDETIIRIEIAGVDTLAKGGDTTNGPWASRSFDSTDKHPSFVVVRENVAASLQDIDIDGKMHEGLTGDQDMHDRAGVVFSMELAGAPPAAVARRRVGIGAGPAMRR